MPLPPPCLPLPLRSPFLHSSLHKPLLSSRLSLYVRFHPLLFARITYFTFFKPSVSLSLIFSVLHYPLIFPCCFYTQFLHSLFIPRAASHSSPLASLTPSNISSSLHFKHSHSSLPVSLLPFTLSFVFLSYLHTLPLLIACLLSTIYTRLCPSSLSFPFLSFLVSCLHILLFLFTRPPSVPQHLSAHFTLQSFTLPSPSLCLSSLLSNPLFSLLFSPLLSFTFPF